MIMLNVYFLLLKEGFMGNYNFSFLCLFYFYCVYEYVFSIDIEGCDYEVM